MLSRVVTPRFRSLVDQNPAFFVMATRKVHALVQVHLTTANQSEICRAYLVSVMATRKMHALVQVHLTRGCADGNTDIRQESG